MSIQTKPSVLCTFALAAILSACGGGSSSSETPAPDSGNGNNGNTGGSTTPPPPPAPELAFDTVKIFQSGFETGISVVPDTENSQYAYLRGSDSNFSELNDWQQDIDHSQLDYVGIFRLWYEQGDVSQRYADILDDPTDSSNKVLAFEILQDHIFDAEKPDQSKGRVQAALADNGQLSEIYTKVRLYLHPDLEALTLSEEAISWFTLQEFWNNLPEKTNPYRVTLNLQKTAGTNKSLHFGAHGQTREMVEGQLRWIDQWKVDPVESFTLPTGEWMTLETYYKEGDADAGRFIVRVTDADGQAHDIVDINDATRHPSGIDDGVSHFNPMKLYTSGQLINQMRDADKKVMLYWDDFELWVNGEDSGN